MGGKALQQFGAERFSKKEYYDICNELKNIFYKEYNNYKFKDLNNLISFPKILPDKENFGDIDIIVKNPIELNICKNINDWIIKIFGNVIIKPNGNVYSFLYKNKYQIDLIIAPIEKFDNYILYYDWSGLSMFFGVIARHMGLKFGLNGFELRQITNKCGDIQIPKTNNEFFNFFKISKEIYDKGFQNEIDIFKYIWSCPYACHKIFEKPSGAAKHRKREKDSKLYNNFLKWVFNQQPKKSNDIFQLPVTFKDKILLIREATNEHHDISVKSKFEIHLENIVLQNYWQNIDKEHFNFNIFTDWFQFDSIIDAGKCYSYISKQLNDFKNTYSYNLKLFLKHKVEYWKMKLKK